MASSNYRRRIRTKPPPPDIAEKYLHYWDMGELYHHPERFPKVTSPILFGNENPLELEIGCGCGEHLVALAAENPDINFVGVDTSLKALNQAVLRAAKKRLDNIRFIRADIKLVYPLLEPSSIRMVYLHFPVPNRGRYRNRRIFTQVFLDVFYKVLESNGRISFISDDQRYYEKIRSLAEDDRRFSIQREFKIKANTKQAPASHYLRLWLDRGRNAWGFVLKPG